MLHGGVFIIKCRRAVKLLSNDNVYSIDKILSQKHVGFVQNGLSPFPLPQNKVPINILLNY